MVTPRIDRCASRGLRFERARSWARRCGHAAARLTAAGTCGGNRRSRVTIDAAPARSAESAVRYRSANDDALADADPDGLQIDLPSSGAAQVEISVAHGDAAAASAASRSAR